MRLQRWMWILTGAILCVLICATQIPATQESVSGELFNMEWEKELQDVPLNGIIKLSDLFSFEWDSIDIVNSPLGLKDFDWEEIYDYNEELSNSMASSETICALIFRLDGQIIDILVYNYANPGSIVFRTHMHDGLSDTARYSRDEAKFQATYIGSFEEIVYLPAQ